MKAPMKFQKKYFLVWLALFAISGLSNSLSAADANSPVLLADEPLTSEASAPVNMLLIADDSGSMTWSHAPDYLGDVERACWRSADGGYWGTICSPLDPRCQVADKCDLPYPNVTAEKAKQLVMPPLATAAFNKLAYNPEIDYLPPVAIKNDSTDSGVLVSYPYMDKATTANWTQVGWPSSVSGLSGFSRPDGVPAVVDMSAFKSDTTNRTYLPEQKFSLVQRYMVSAPSGEIAKIVDGMPPHYFKTSIKWCRYYQARTATPDGNPITPSAFYEGSLFLGSASPQDCQDARTDTYKYPYYYFPNGKYTTPNKENHLQAPSFEVVVLDPQNLSGNVTHTYVEDGVLKTKTRTTEEELTNYATWYAYYSNRTAATRTVTSLALAGLDKTKPVQVGFSTINKDELVQSMALFKGADREAVFKTLLGHGVDAIANKGTPLKTALNRFGKEFEKKSASAFIKYSCQRNYNLLLTDGLWNDGDFADVDNRDLKIQNNLPEVVRIYGDDLLKGYFWPFPIREGPVSASNTLSDVSLSFWEKDVRPDFKSAGKGYNVDATNKDPAKWPHLNLIGLTFGAEGTLPTLSQKDVLKAIRNESMAWPKPEKNKASAVDDLWHATVNGFGLFMSSTKPEDFKTSLSSLFSGILNRGGTYAETGLPSRNTNDTANHGYYASFRPGWAGDVQKKELDTDVKAWSAAERLAERLKVKPGIPAPWETQRNVLTSNPKGQGIPFRYADLDPTQLTVLGADANAQKDMISYLRGDKTNEFVFDGEGKYRARQGPLGDIVHAAPVVIDAPAGNYKESGSGAAGANKGYAAFVQDNKNRARTIYVSGNDGMVHAFDDKGEELWAFLPSALLRPASEAGIVNLSTAPEDNKKEKHYFYADATPRVLDAQLGETGHENWRTLMVGGMGKGGKAYFALDVTDPNAVVSNIGTAFKWQFSDKNLGYTYGRALVVKTKDKLWGTKWVAILPSGLNNSRGAPGSEYENADGKGRLFFVDLDKGTSLHEIATSAGDPDNPSGLAYIRGYVESADNQVVTAVYGGDQLGNVWRFDLSADDHKQWSVVKLAELRDSSGQPQPVNTEPRMEVTTKSNGTTTQRWVLIGTGRLYHENDIYPSKTRTYGGVTYPGIKHSMYAFLDGDDAKVDGTLLAPYQRTDLANVTGALPGLKFDDAKNPPSQKGWVNDFDDDYQILVNSDTAYDTTVYAASRFIPPEEQGDPCKESLFTSRIYARDVASGDSSIYSLKSSTGYIEVDSGVAGIKIINDNGTLKVGYNTLDGNSIFGKFKLGVKGGDPAGVTQPRRTSIRFIN